MSQIIEIPFDQLHESPSNPRKHYNPADDAEMAADIRAHGRILQPLLVRPRIPELFRALPDAAETAACGYEIVFGHRRFRNGQAAGLATAPCMVRSMSDEEVKRAQISENLQRKDVHPIEEAEGFQALINEHNETADRIAEQTGKSRSYVYGRLKLLQACPEIRTACVKGDIGSEVALLIARLRLPKLQAKALAAIKSKAYQLSDGGKESFRRIKALLNEHFTLDLKAAPFDIEEEMLLPAAGNCVSCPKRSGNAPEFDDVATDTKKSQWAAGNCGPNVCTDPDCFAEKKAAHFKRDAEAMRAKGKVVIDGAKARAALGADGQPKGAYVTLTTVREQMTKARNNALKDATITLPQVVVIQDPRTGKSVEAVKASELVAAGAREAAAKPSGNNRPQGGTTAEEREAQRQAANKEAEQISADRLQLLLQVRTAMHQAERSLFDMRLLASQALKGVAYDDQETLETLWGCEFDDLDDRIQAMEAQDLTHFMLDCALIPCVTVDQWSLRSEAESLNAAAAHYGIVAQQIQADAPTASTPATPLPAESNQAERGAEGGEADEQALEDKATAPAAAQPKGASKTTVKYRNAATGETWSGRGLQPKWLRVALEGGASLADFDMAEQQAAKAAT